MHPLLKGTTKPDNNLKSSMKGVYMRGEAGSRGKDVRSDAWVCFEPTDDGKQELNLKSKVQSMYGESTEKLIRDMMTFFGFDSYHIEIEDQGALPFVLMARIEVAIKRALPDTKKEYIPSYASLKTYTSKRDRLRRSRLYLPGNSPKFFINAGLHKPDGIILDLEDSVSPSEKDAARILVRNALCSIDFLGAERMIRINQGELGMLDIDMLIQHNVDLVLIPKVEEPDDVIRVDEAIKGIVPDKEVFIMPIIESCKGVENAYHIGISTNSVVALAIGLEDYTADLGTQRTEEGGESIVSRCRVVNAAKAAGVQGIDTVYSDVGNMLGLLEDVRLAKSLGFEGKGCIHPRQIPVVHQGFAPEQQELDKALKIVDAFKKATEMGLGVVSLGTKMIDPPVVKRALRTVELARLSGLLME